MTGPHTERYDRLLALADQFDRAGSELRSRASLGEQIVRDPAIAESAPLSPTTFDRFAEAVADTATGAEGLVARSVELDADALVLRATVLTYRWIDELQEAAYRTIGSVAGRAIGYLAPGVALGGAIVSAGLIETDALDRDGVAAYLEELAQAHPELLEHVSTGGGLLDGLQMRSLLTAGVLASDAGPAAARGGLRATGAEPFATDLGSALRDVAGGLLGPPDEPGPAPAPAAPIGVERLGGLEDLMTALTSAPDSVCVHEVGPGRYVAFLPGPHVGAGGRRRLAGGDHLTYAQRAIGAIEAALAPATEPARVMLVGCAQGGVTAVDIAVGVVPAGFVVEQVVTAGAPAALVPRVPDGTRVLSLEDRRDPVSLLGSLVAADAGNRLTVVFDGDGATGPASYVAGGRAADAAPHPELRAEIERMRRLGFLGPSSNG